MQYKFLVHVNCLSFKGYKYLVKDDTTLKLL